MHHKNILLFGAGKSATVLIDYLIEVAGEHNWLLTVADANQSLIEQKTKNRPFTESIALDITHEGDRKLLISKSDIVISMMPPHLHILIAKDCITYKKSLLTASYEDDQIKSLGDAVEKNGLLFLCEMGLDPGIDHMSALHLINKINSLGGEITSFKSHCGGLVAPESDDNPWHYKISWNPRNVVLAGKSGAVYKKNNQLVKEDYQDLFDASRTITLTDNGNETFSFYPNRNSLPYIELYGLEHAHTFIRTTLRHPAFVKGWKHLVDLDLTNETILYPTDHISLKDFFSAHSIKNENQKPDALMAEQLLYIGFEDTETIINKGNCSAADVIQFCMEKKLALHPGDRDMIVMLHEIEYQINGKNHTVDSSLIVKGDDHIHTAMSKTVGLPLGIAAKMILNGTIQLTGIHIPVIKEIYNPVLEELNKQGISFKERFR